MTDGWRYVGKAVGLVLLLLVALEWSVRWLAGLGSPPLLMKDEQIGYLFQPDQTIRRFGNRIVINRYSQRTSPVDAVPASDALRILAVGDSVTWGGVQVDQAETYPAQLQAWLQHASTQKVEVLNASAASWGVGNQWAYLQRFGIFGARLVVLQIGSEDLFQPTSRGDLVGVHPAMPDHRPMLALQEIWSRYVAPRCFPGSVVQPEVYSFNEERLESNLSLFREMVRWVKASGAEILVVHSPYREEVMPGFKPDTARLPSSARERFLAVAGEEGVPVLNLVSAWRLREDASSYFFRDTIHWTKVGNRRAAEDIGACIVSQWPSWWKPSAPRAPGDEKE